MDGDNDKPDSNPREEELEMEKSRTVTMQIPFRQYMSKWITQW